MNTEELDVTTVRACVKILCEKGLMGINRADLECFDEMISWPKMKPSTAFSAIVDQLYKSESEFIEETNRIQLKKVQELSDLRTRISVVKKELQETKEFIEWKLKPNQDNIQEKPFDPIVEINRCYKKPIVPKPNRKPKKSRLVGISKKLLKK